MTKEEYYAEESRYDAQQEAMYELREEDDDENAEPYEDEWQSHGFRNAADYWNWKL